MPKLTITRDNDDGYEPVHIRVLLDGEEIADGGIGGEPEDNCEALDGGWIVPGFRKLAERFGCEVEEKIAPDDGLL